MGVFMDGNGFCAWTFEQSVGCPYEDVLVARFKALLDHYGFVFPRENNVPERVVATLNSNPSLLTNRDWSITKYPFLQEDRAALKKLHDGETSFSTKETEALEALCGDFFDLNGLPRHRNTNQAPARQVGLRSNVS